MSSTKPFLFLVAGLLMIGQTARSQSVSSLTDSLRNLLHSSLPDTNRVKLLLALGRVYIFKPGEQKVDLDTAIIVAQQAFRLSHQIAYERGKGLSYLVVGQAQREKGNKKLGKSLIQQAINKLAKWGTEDDQADAYIEMANYYTLADEDLTEKTKLYERAVPLLQQTSAKKKLADALKYRGDLYQIQNKNAQALSDLRQALELYRSIGHTQLQDVYDLLGTVSTATGDFENGLHYGLLALKTAQQANDSSLSVTLFNRIGITYARLRQFNEAVFYWQKSLNAAKRIKDVPAIIPISLNLITVYHATQQDHKALKLLQQLSTVYPPTNIPERVQIAANFLRVYTALGQFGPAQQVSRQLLKLTEQLGPDDRGQSFARLSIASFCIATKQYKRAEQVLALDKAYCERLGQMDMLAANQLSWFKLDSAQSNYRSAINYYQQYHALKESFLAQTQSKQIKELDIQYKTYEKQLSIEQLTHKSELQQSQLNLQQAQLSATQLTRNFSLAVAFLLVLLLGLSYNRYRLKQRSHQLLAAKQVEINQNNESLQLVLNEKDELLIQKEWMLKEIHHRVKNNLQIVAGLLYSQGTYLKDKAAQSAVRESQNRVQAMALLHQKLYQSDRLASVPMAEYIHEIVDHLIHSFDQLSQVKTQLEVASVELDVTLAVPLGLIVNEAVTNSLKYGFPSGKPGRVTIQLAPDGATQYVLRIHDDGVGLPADFDPKRSRSLGMSLIRGLSKQIGADLQITSEHGVTVNLRFSHDALARNSA